MWAISWQLLELETVSQHFMEKPHRQDLIEELDNP